MNEYITYAPSTLSTYLCIKLQISVTNIKRIIGFSNVQELVQFFKIYFLRKSHVSGTRKWCNESNAIL